MRSLLAASLVLALLAGSADAAALFTGLIEQAKVRIRATSEGNRWTGRWRCRGRECPVHRGQATWLCFIEGNAGTILKGGAEQCEWLGPCRTDQGSNDALLECFGRPSATFVFVRTK